MAVDERTCRLERERAHHNRAFAEPSRHGVKKYYAIATASRVAYEAAVSLYARGARVLEYGCGCGSSAWRLSAIGAQVTGIASPKSRSLSARSVRDLTGSLQSSA